MNAQTQITAAPNAEALKLAAGNADILRAIRDGLHARASAIGHVAGRPRKNAARDVAVLVRVGLVSPPPGGFGPSDRPVYELTEQGRQVLAGLDLAEGLAEPGAPAGGVLYLRHHQIRANPLQPRKHFDAEELEGLKASIAAAGDVIQNLAVFPADAEGVHVLAAGERRWRAVGELIAEGMWPGDKPLRAILREHTPGQTAFIGLVENGQRANLAMIEQARAYAELCAETGWSARQAALKTGRDPRTVQEMLRVLEKADPNDIAAHEQAPGSYTWEWLRSSVREPGAAPEEPQQADVEEVVDAAPEAPVIVAGQDGGGAMPEADAQGTLRELTPGEWLTLVELAYALETPDHVRPSSEQPLVRAVRYWLDQPASDLGSTGLKLLEFVHNTGAGGPYATLTQAGRDCLWEQGVEAPISFEHVWKARVAAGIAPHEATRSEAFVTPWLNVDADQAPARLPDVPTSEDVGDLDDLEPPLETDPLRMDADRLADEVVFWRQDAAARLRTALTLAKAAEEKGEDQRAAEIRVSILMPTRAALASALTGDLYYPTCEGCSRPIEEGDAVFAFEDEGEAHVDCDDPQHPSELPEHAYRYAHHSENSPDGIVAALAAARAYLNAEDGA